MELRKGEQSPFAEEPCVAPGVPGVERPGDESQVAGLVASGVVDPVHVEAVFIPAWEGDSVSQERSPVSEPFIADGDPPAAIVGVGAVLGVGASGDHAGVAMQPPISHGVVGDDVDVSAVGLAVGSSCVPSALGASVLPTEQGPVFTLVVCPAVAVQLAERIVSAPGSENDEGAKPRPHARAASECSTPNCITAFQDLPS